jgi:hypothetical protein
MPIVTLDYCTLCSGRTSNCESQRHRTELILSWRFVLIPLISQSEADWINHRERVLTTPEYASLRSHLSRRARKKFEAERAIFVGEAPRTRLIADEIAHIERKWELV